MRVRTYVLTVAGALALSFSVLAQQAPPAGPPQPPAAPPLGPPAPFYAHIVATVQKTGHMIHDERLGHRRERTDQHGNSHRCTWARGIVTRTPW